MREILSGLLATGSVKECRELSRAAPRDGAEPADHRCYRFPNPRPQKAQIGAEVDRENRRRLPARG